MAKANKLIPVVDGTAGTPIELTDSRIEITNPAANDLLQYDSTQQQFVNTPASSVMPSHRTVNHEQITDSSLGDINLHDGFYFPNAVQDYDGNWYGAVVIGDQVWLGENLRTTHYADGTAVDYVDATTSTFSLRERGLFYTYYAVMHGANSTTSNPSGVQGVAPTGWHIPSPAEFAQLNTYLQNNIRYSVGGNRSNIGKSLASTYGWDLSETQYSVGYEQEKNNKSGFNAIPVGRLNLTSLEKAGNRANFATTQGNSNSNPYIILTDYVTGGTTSVLHGSIWRFSVRCVSDLTPVQFRDWYVKTYGTLQHNIHPMEELSDVEIDNTPVDFKYIPDAVTDYDGNSYGAVVIGNKVWMAENLRTTHYADGTAIALGTGNVYTPAYFNNTSSSIPLEIRGYYYNYPAVTKGTSGSSTNPSNFQGVAPNGWHVPSDAEFLETENYISAYLGGSQISSGNDVFDNRFTDVAFAKSIASKDYWQSSDVSDTPGNNPNLNNSCGLGLTPNGMMINSGCSYVGERSYLWTCTVASGRYIRRSINCANAGIYRYNTADAVGGYNVRCVYNGTPQQFMDEMYSKLMDKQVLVYDASKQMWVNKNVAETLPTMSGNSGKVLAVNNDEKGVEWVTQNIPDDSNLVHLTGAETITGEKTTTADIVLANTTASADSPAVIFKRGVMGDAYTDWLIRGSAGNLNFYRRTNEGTTERFRMAESGNLTVFPANSYVGYVTATGFKTITSSTGFLKANGSIDSTSYQPALPVYTSNAGKVLAVNSGETGVEWVTQSGGSGGGASQLNDLSDVTISSAASGQALLHNGTNWVNGALPQEVFMCTFTSNNGTHSMDKTPEEIYQAVVASKKIAICKFNAQIFYCYYAWYDNNSYTIKFSQIQVNGTTEHLVAYIWNTGNTWYYKSGNLQSQLVDSGTNQNIKTINSESLLGAGNISIISAAEMLVSLNAITGSTYNISYSTTNRTMKVVIDDSVTTVNLSLNTPLRQVVYKLILDNRNNTQDVVINIAHLQYSGTDVDDIILDPLLSTQEGRTIKAGDVMELEHIDWASNGVEIGLLSRIFGSDKLANAVTIYSGTSAPSSGTGSDGDIYIQTVS